MTDDDPCRPGCPLCNWGQSIIPGSYRWSPALVEAAIVEFARADVAMFKELALGSN